MPTSKSIKTKFPTKGQEVLLTWETSGWIKFSDAYRTGLRVAGNALGEEKSMRDWRRRSGEAAVAWRQQGKPHLSLFPLPITGLGVCRLRWDNEAARGRRDAGMRAVSSREWGETALDQRALDQRLGSSGSNNTRGGIFPFSSPRQKWISGSGLLQI